MSRGSKLMQGLTEKRYIVPRNLSLWMALMNVYPVELAVNYFFLIFRLLTFPVPHREPRCLSYLLKARYGVLDGVT